MPNPQNDFLQIIHVLRAHDVEFVVVGALSAVLHGAPIMTLDIDIVHERSAENVERALEALEELDARYRGHAERPLRATSDRLRGPGHQLMMTTFGPLDLLGVIEGGADYDTLLKDAVTLDLEGDEVRVLSLRRYLEFKEASDRPKDRAMVPVLQETLRELEKDDESASENAES